MRYLVTGGAGFIGSALVRSLVADGHEVSVLDDTSRGRWDRLDGVSCLELAGDIRDPDAVQNAVRGCDTVVHLAYINGTQTFYAEPRAVLDIALRGILNLAEACRSCGTGDILLVSSSEAYQVAPLVPTPEDVPLTVPDVLNPRYSYGGGKIASELVTLAWQRAGIFDRAIVARPHNIIGPDMGGEHVIPEFAQRMGKLAREQPEGIIPFPIQGTGLETRSFCWIGDCVAQLRLLLDRAPQGPGVWHLGQEDERTIADVAHAVAACYSRQIKVEPGVLPKGSPPRRLPSTAKIRALGPLPEAVPFAEAVARTVAWYQQHG